MKQDYKRAIEELEYNYRKHQSGIDIKVVNIYELKTYVKADVIVKDWESGYIERFNDCEYPKSQLYSYKL